MTDDYYLQPGAGFAGSGLLQVRCSLIPMGALARPSSSRALPRCSSAPLDKFQANPKNLYC